jgi:hypothetical protein
MSWVEPATSRAVSTHVLLRWAFPVEFQAENSDTVEVGFKSVWMAGDLVLNADVDPRTSPTSRI